MPLMDINKPEILKFLVENYEKEKKIRHKWVTLHKDQIIKAAVFTRKQTGYDEAAILQKVATLGFSITKRDQVAAGYNRKKMVPHDNSHICAIADIKHDYTIQSLGLGDPKDDPKLARPDTDLSPDPIMRPINEKQRLILYKNIPDNGRQAYLNSRNEIRPENRYYFAETSGMKYGWRLEDQKYTNMHSYGRVWQLARLRSRSGPQPNPPYYGSSSAITKTIKCSK